MLAMLLVGAALAGEPVGAEEPGPPRPPARSIDEVHGIGPVAFGTGPSVGFSVPAALSAGAEAWARGTVLSFRLGVSYPTLSAHQPGRKIPNDVLGPGNYNEYTSRARCCSGSLLIGLQPTSLNAGYALGARLDRQDFRLKTISGSSVRRSELGRATYASAAFSAWVSIPANYGYVMVDFGLAVPVATVRTDDNTIRLPVLNSVIQASWQPFRQTTLDAQRQRRQRRRAARQRRREESSGS